MESFYGKMMMFWALVIVMYSIAIFRNNKKIKSLGTVIFTTKSKTSRRLFNIMLLTALLVQNIMSYINSKELYWIISSVGILTIVIYMSIKAFRKNRVYENGIFVSNHTLFWDDIKDYKIFDLEEEFIVELRVKYKILFVKYKNRKVGFKLKKEELELLENILSENNKPKIVKQV